MTIFQTPRKKLEEDLKEQGFRKFDYVPEYNNFDELMKVIGGLRGRIPLTTEVYMRQIPDGDDYKTEFWYRLGKED